MKKNILKKGAVVLSLVFILSSFAIPANFVFAKSLEVLGAGSGGLTGSVNSGIPIIVRTSANQTGVLIQFTTNPSDENISFSPKASCTTNNEEYPGSCFVYLISTKAGVFNLGLVTFGAGYDPTPLIPITVTEAAVNLKTNPNANNTDTTYTPLAPLPGFMDKDGNPIPFPTDQECAFGKYLNTMIDLIIGLVAVGAVVMIVLGGMEYMTSELISSKEHGKERIRNALLGIIIAIGAYALLYTINPALLEVCTTLPQVKIVIDDEPESGIQGTGKDKKTITLSKLGGGTQQLTACEEGQMVSISLFGSNVRVYKGVALSLQRINAKWQTMSPQYPVYSVGGYNCRQVKGKSGFWSAHAFGLALDINPETNPFGQEKITDMPDNFVKLFTDESERWGWGGNWTNVKDAMHFSKIPPNEGGNGIVEP